MPVALKNGALTTLDALKAALQISATVTNDDDRLRRAINVATAQITKFCDRSFHRVDIVDERQPTKAGPRIVLNRAPLVTLTAASVGSASGLGFALSTDLLQVEDSDAAIVFVRSVLPIFAQRRWGIAGDLQPGTEPPDLLITYSGGFVTPEQADIGGAFVGQTVTLPDDLEQASIELAAHVYQTPIGFVAGEVASEKLGDAQITYRDDVGGGMIDRAIPAPIRAKLAGYKRFSLL